MEEFVGSLWHRLVTRGCEQRYPDAAVELGQVKKSLGVLFRAGGGAPGLSIDAVAGSEHGARRTWRQKLAGSNRQFDFTWKDEQALRLPARIDLFADAGLNRDLYLWLASMAAMQADSGSWIRTQQQLCQQVLVCYPGMRSRYERLVVACCAARPDAGTLSAEEARRETAIRQALHDPGSVDQLPAARRPPFPVWLWLHPSPPQQLPAGRRESTDAESDSESRQQSQAAKQPRRYQAKHTEMPSTKSALILNRFESILSWAEYIKVDRATEDDDDLDNAEQVAEDLQELTLAQDSNQRAKSIRFDLDLPPADQDDQPLGDGILLPEWDFHKQQLVAEQCRLQPMIAQRAEPQPLPNRLRPLSRRLRAQFEALRPTKIWLRAQTDGSELDLDAYLQFRSDRASGRASSESGLYRQRRNRQRDLSCLLLADLSLSTDAWVGDNHRVIDVIRDSLYLFAEALSGTRDRFSMYGFSSRRRDYIRWHQLKAFDEAYDNQIRGRLQAIRPGYFTRMGAAIRYATLQLLKESSEQRILLLLTDGKPNDLDHYEGRYGIEDTRMAIVEARRHGLQPFCVTIDSEGNDYLPHLFGSTGYAVIHRPQDLPRELPLLYAKLTG